MFIQLEKLEWYEKLQIKSSSFHKKSGNAIFALFSIYWCPLYYLVFFVFKCFPKMHTNDVDVKKIIWEKILRFFQNWKNFIFVSVLQGDPCTSRNSFFLLLTTWKTWMIWKTTFELRKILTFHEKSGDAMFAPLVLYGAHCTSVSCLFYHQTWS